MASGVRDTEASTTWVLFELGATVCALPASTVLSVLEPTPPTRVPFAPPSIIGLIADAGGVMPLVDPKQLLFETASAVAEAPVDAEPAVLRCRFGASLVGLLVDRLLLLAEIDPSHVMRDAEAGSVLAGTWSWRERTVLLLQPGPLDLADLNPVLPDTGVGGWVGTAASQSREVRQTLGDPMIVVAIGSEQYAIPVADVGEIVTAGPTTPVPKAPPEVAGIGVLRREPLLMLRLDRLLQRTGLEPRSYIVVERPEVGRFGLLFDRVIGLRRYRAKSQHGILETRHGLDGYFLESDGVVTPSIDLARLVDADLVRQFAGGNADRRQVQRADLRQFLSFAVGGEMFALPIDAVDRVLTWRAPTPLPGGEAGALLGVIELQGEVVPVGDLNRRLGIAADGSAGALLVVRSEVGHTAFGVDRVHRIISVPVTAIEAVGGGNDAVVEIGRIEDRLFWILSADRLASAA
ncbi:MAG: hypothetical protein EAZ99_08810 [Alphaproteobacteria bacterium]|nr:chemotaxis protein CheW [Alphaproteobacteria bacterium]TAD89719.1 MAG: hypothetical protein EAZ99_08810 [Alphaproteobacteria bacterium]